MRIGGIDAHRSYLTISVVDSNGLLVAEQDGVRVGDGEPLLETLDGGWPLEVVLSSQDLGAN